MTAETEKRTDCLYVRMLGDFSMEYRGMEVLKIKDRKRSSKMLHLLQILLYEGAKGIAKEQLLLRLYGRDAKEDRSNNLRVTMYHLRKMLGESGLPGKDFIRVREGRYWFESSFPVEVDARMFIRILQRADGLRGQKCAELLKEACSIYRGYFLPLLAGEEWAAVEEAYFQRLYAQSMEKLLSFLKEQKEYEELFRWSGQAARLYPYDEWQIWQMESLTALGRMEEALILCENTTRMYLKEPGISVSERMFESFRKMRKNIRADREELPRILESFQEKGMGKGAYGCSFLGFIDSYRLLARTAAHSGCPGYVLLCSVTDGRKRHPAASGGLLEASKKLEESVQEALGDEAVYLQYSRTQFLALLPWISREECQTRIGRIDVGFRRRESSRRVGVTYRMMQI